MDIVIIIVCALIAIGTFLFWEFVAWFSHKYIMHGVLWSWHKSHHTVHHHALEKNDLFALVFSIPSIGLFYYFSIVNYNPYLIAVAIGIFCYGFFYLVFHDIIVHQRAQWRPQKRSRYLQRMINAHYIHHGKHTKEGCEAFGFLYAPKNMNPKRSTLKRQTRNTIALNPKYLYLTIDFLSIVFPFIFSFYAKAPFYKKWKYAWVAILIPAFVFIIWDEAFTYLGVWGFNPTYLTGIYVGVLPIEEILFFICIPYACLFIYFAINHLVERDYLFPHQELISSALIILLLIFGIYNIDKWYTGTTFTLLALALAFLMLKIRPRFMGRFYFAFGFILVPFLIVNGILTGSFIDGEVVWYNDKENLGIRLATIPFEDVFYGMLLLLCNISVFEWLQEHYRNK